MSYEAAMDRLNGLRSAAEQRGQQAHSRVISPAQARYSESLTSAPLTTLFATVFVCLSAVPVLIFAAYATISAIVIFSIASFIALVVVGGALALLIGTLIGTAILAGFGTAWIAGLYLAYRVVVNVSQARNIVEGVQATTDELRTLASGNGAAAAIDEPTTVKKEAPAAVEEDETPVDTPVETPSGLLSQSPSIEEKKHEGS